MGGLQSHKTAGFRLNLTTLTAIIQTIDLRIFGYFVQTAIVFNQLIEAKIKKFAISTSLDIMQLNDLCAGDVIGSRTRLKIWGS